MTSFPMTGNMLYMFPDVKEVAAAAIDTASRMDAGTHRTSQSICCVCIPEVVQISQVSCPQYSCMVYHLNLVDLFWEMLVNIAYMDPMFYGTSC